MKIINYLFICFIINFTTTFSIFPTLTLLLHNHDGRIILLYMVTLLCKVNLDVLPRFRLKRLIFLFKSVRFSLVWGFHVS